MLDELFDQFDNDPVFDNTATAAALVAEPVTAEPGPGRIEDAATAMRFLTAGNATVTLVSKVTEARFTYRVRTSEDGRMRFVQLLTGNNNEGDFKYLGHIKIGQEIYYHGRKSKIAFTAPSAKAFDWAWRALAQNKIPAQLEIWHEGRCGRCGRKLTVPESIATGFGPECAGRIGL
jgi:hypothetical protein